MTYPEVIALADAHARRTAQTANLSAELAAWMLSVIPAAVSAGIAAAFGDGLAATELSARVVELAPKWTVPIEEED